MVVVVGTGRVALVPGGSIRMHPLQQGATAARTSSNT
jgi:hypothetical protein